MSESPQTISALIDALNAAIARLGDATSFQQRKARNQVCVNRGVALYDRIQELQKWLNTASLMREDDPTALDDQYRANLKKYEEGWTALNAAMEFTRNYKREHWSEDMSQGAPRRRRTYPVTKETVPQSTHKPAKEEQAVML